MLGIEQKRTIRSMLLIRELVYTQFIFKNLALGVQVMKFRTTSVIYHQYVFARITFIFRRYS